MKWFKKWFQNKCIEAWENRDRPECVSAESPKSRLSNCGIYTDYDDEHYINLRVYAANGGVIVESSKYDKTRDRNRTKIYVFADSEGTDLGSELSKIVTMESLR